MRRKLLLLFPAVLLLLGTAVLWRSNSEGRSLSGRAQAELIRRTAERPSSWRGWELLHVPDPGWTDHRQAGPEVRPVAQPLAPPGPFFLVDDSRSLPPEQAAEEAVRGMLHWLKANQAGQGYQVLDFRVGEQKLMKREDVVKQALSHCGTRALNGRSGEQLQAWCRSFFGQYPGLGEDMWVLEPAFSLKWSGTIAGVSHKACVEGGLADKDGFVDLRAVFRRTPMSSSFLLIRQDHRYRLQYAESFFDQYEGRGAKDAPPPVPGARA